MGVGIEVANAVEAALPWFPDAQRPLADTVRLLCAGRPVRSDPEAVTITGPAVDNCTLRLAIRDSRQPRYAIHLTVRPMTDVELADRRERGRAVDRRGPVTDLPGPWRVDKADVVKWGLFNAAVVSMAIVDTRRRHRGRRSEGLQPEDGG